MSGEAPVNTGAVAWPDDYPAGVAVRRMQTKLHRWATEDPGRRFGDLHNLVYDPAFLVVAWQRVSTNKGARTPGVDKATTAQIEAWIGVGAFLSQIRESLKSGEFRPVEVRQVKIPKSNGKLRKLGIPTVTDRVVQASLKLVLEPIFEADFKPCSYGFRPNRRAQDAIAEIHLFTSESINYRWIFEADIKACFDEIDHTAVMDRLRRRIKDKQVCALVKAFLKSGVLTELGNKEETLTGTPQGGILSPLLANVALSALDDHFDQQWRQNMGDDKQRRARKKKGMGNWRLVRYCDDFVIMVGGERHHAEALRAEVAAVLAPLGLRLAPEKTRVVHVDEGFTFLGFDIRQMRKRGTSKHYVCTKPSKKAVQSIKDKVRAKTSSAASQARSAALSSSRGLFGYPLLPPRDIMPGPPDQDQPSGDGGACLPRSARPRPQLCKSRARWRAVTPGLGAPRSGVPPGRGTGPASVLRERPRVPSAAYPPAARRARAWSRRRVPRHRR